MYRFFGGIGCPRHRCARVFDEILQKNNSKTNQITTSNFINLITASRLQHSGPLHFCTTPPCLEAAADLLAKQNSSHDACTDFWGYACGGWLRRNPMPSSAASWSVLEDLHHRQIVEKSRLITMSAHEPSQFNSVEWKVHNFYESCMALGKSFSLCDTDWTVNDVVAERKIPLQITTSLAEMPLGFQIRVGK